jgi:5-methylcytosine-specific restriction endonuclease McrA
MVVFCLDKHHNPIMPCSEKKARIFLERNRAAIHRIVPMVIRLKDISVDQICLNPLRLKIDPGSKETGLAVLDGHKLIWAGVIVHKQGIRSSLKSRRALRRNRRSRKTRYRPARFYNRYTPEGWIAPSLNARVDQTMAVVNKLSSWLPITNYSIELTKFDTQLMQNPAIQGVQYQRGTHWGYEVREYLLEKYDHKCAYCGTGEAFLEVEHIVPRSRGGTDRLSNLCIACHRCNQEKNDRTAAEFGHPEVHAKAKEPLKDAAAMNITRFKVLDELKKTRQPIELGSGGRTKFNRTWAGLPKTHYFDAAMIGASSPECLEIRTEVVNVWYAKGRGNRVRTQIDKYGFRRVNKSGELSKPKIPHKIINGFAAGDIVRNLDGRIKKLARAREGKGCKLLQRGDGWDYRIERIAPVQ